MPLISLSDARRGDRGRRAGVKHRNVARAWVDYRKAYDMVPHSWIIESSKLALVAQNVIEFIERSMVNWKIDLTSHGQTVGTVNKKGGIFQGDSLPSFIFIICLVSMSWILRKVKVGYILENMKVNLYFYG